VGDPVKWALDRLGFARESNAPSSRDVQRNYRERLREVHPDHGAEVAGAAQRIAELSEARRILIGR
jgi:curved DNA-binding protein CbpA